ncbi:hypothetical protein [Rhizobium sp.]
MAKTHRIKHVDDTFTIRKDKDTWIFLKSASIKAGQDENAITVDDAGKATIVFQNRIKALEHGIFATGDNLRIEVDRGARISAGFNPIALQADDSVVINRGTLESHGGSAAIHVVAYNFELRNFGTLKSDPGGYSVITQRSGADIYNEKGGRIEGYVYFSLNDGDTGTFVNRGVVRGEEFAVSSFYGDVTVVNHGKLVGKVALGYGDNLLDTRGGTLSTKQFEGGGGDDMLITDNAKYRLIEEAGGGNDTIKSTVSYRLADNSNVENLVLIGRKNIDATGSAQGETIRGNSADNRINGGGGNDQIYGGKGDDRLTGGGQGTFDDFYFKTGDGRDVITDFEGFPDRIFIGRWHGMSDFEEVLDNARFKGGDMVIKAGKDSITLLGIDRDDISAQDFDFSMS